MDKIIVDSQFYEPVGEVKNVAIIFLGGSGGNMPIYNYDNFTSNGYSSLSLGYFGTKNTPDKLEMIPLEYFRKAIDEFKENPYVKGKKIVLIGTSKGGELALLLGSTFNDISGVVANVPSSVVFQGINYDSFFPKSSWSYKGKPIPFVPYAKVDVSKIINNHYLDLFNLSLENKEAVIKATIKVEEINGPILLLSGDDDIMWPSSKMCEDIMNRLKNNNFKYKYDHYLYKNAGHLFYYGNPKYYGGTIYGNFKANEDANIIVMDFLEDLSNN
ncbi:acyl-CoA thioester hydrolase/BAAT C-terminal domain-containing protein [Thiospirochaeta perfilievii]|nr:acyl-CoA thioester hydrolase/BAAT C-terminal domain-containing protein [Thiospirochaeta perfilievii]